MSLILDALRKMEKDRKNRRGAGGDLRPEVLRYRGEVAEHSARPYLLVAAGALLLVVGVGAGFLLRGQGEGDPLPAGRNGSAAAAAGTPASAPPATVAAAPVAPGFPGAAPPSATQPPVAAAPAAASEAPVPAALPAAGPATAAGGQAAARSQLSEGAAAGPAASQALAKGPASSALPGEGAAAGTQPAKAKKARKSAAAKLQSPQNPGEGQARRLHQEAQQPVQSGAADITLSGIAWQDERNLRRAVLNGSLVGEGAVVSGARVLEIQETRVRLSRNGHLFDLALSSMPR